MSHIQLFDDLGKPMTNDDTAALGLQLGRLDGLLGFHLRMASATLARDFAVAMDTLGLTQKQCAVLELIEANTGASQVDLATALGTDRATMMALVDRLEARGLLVRSRSSRDRRRQDLALSPAGRALLSDAHRRIRSHEKRFAAKLGAGDAARLMLLLRQLYL